MAVGATALIARLALLPLRPIPVADIHDEFSHLLAAYTPTHDPGRQLEWVYNAADIPRAKAIWARDMGEEDNARLIEHYCARRVWLVEPDRPPVRLEPY